MSEKPKPSLPWPEEDFSVYGPVEATKIARVQHHVGRVMHRNWNSIPHVTHHDDVDISSFEQRRKVWNLANPERKRTLLPVLVKAAVSALQQSPQYNSSLSADGTTIYTKQYYNKQSIQSITTIKCQQEKIRKEWR